MSTGEIIMVPVPREYLSAVYQVLAKPLTSDLTSAESGWTVEDFRALVPVLKPAALTLLDLTSSQPERWVHVRTVEKQSGRPFYNVRGDLASLTRQLRKIGKPHWPVEVREDSNGKLEYRMSSSIARMWREATG